MLSFLDQHLVASFIDNSYFHLDEINLLTFPSLLIGTITPALAQEKMVARDGFKEGYRAVQFGIGNNFTLTNFGNASLNFMRFDSEKKSPFH